MSSTIFITLIPLLVHKLRAMGIKWSVSKKLVLHEKNNRLKIREMKRKIFHMLSPFLAFARLLPV
jgi:hypothetical protein